MRPSRPRSTCSTSATRAARASRRRQDRAARRPAGKRDRRLQRQPSELGRRRTRRDLRRQRQQRQHLRARPAHVRRTRPHRTVAAARPGSGVEGRAAGRTGREPRQRLLYVAEAGVNAVGVIRLNGQHGIWSGTSRPGGGRAASRSAPTAARCMSRTPGAAAPDRTPSGEQLAEVQRAGHRQHHPGRRRKTARRVHRRVYPTTGSPPAGTTMTTMTITASDSGADRPIDPEQGRGGKLANQARRVHQQGERDPRSLARRHHADAQGVPVDGEPASRSEWMRARITTSWRSASPSATTSFSSPRSRRTAIAG